MGGEKGEKESMEKKRGIIRECMKKVEKGLMEKIRNGMRERVGR